ncbi:MAG: N(4)-(beta-N-acetylglucosaminyl)-L-asparaginase [Planctomycetota bacterium]
MTTTRRSVLRAALASGMGLAVAPSVLARSASRSRERGHPGDAPRNGPVVVSSANGLPATERAFALMGEGYDPADAVVAGVTLVENDPNDLTVGYGGLPNERGVIQLDASVMHGPTHKSGAVACIENIKNPAAVALLVLKRTDHCLIVGEGAREFAIQHGFRHEDLMTDRTRRLFLRWKANGNPTDDWLDDDQMDWDARDERNNGLGPIGRAPNPFGEELESLAADYDVRWRGGVPYTTGTINCSAVDANGDVASCTTTSGLSWKIPGRVGDSPICGAGMYCDNDVGAAGGTGRGEAVIVNCGAFSIVRAMERGLTPTEACLEVAGDIVRRTKEKRLRGPDGDGTGRVNFNVTLYAVRKDGAYGSASIFPGGRFAVCDANGNRREASASVYE